jgi:NTE family protein
VFGYEHFKEKKMKPLFLSILIWSITIDLWSQNDYENLVFEGAGIRGIAYSGVIMQLEEYGIIDKMKKVGGTSAGAITAMMLSIGYDSEEIYEIISATRFQKFNKGGLWFLGGIHRVKKRYGWYKSDRFEKWLEEIIESKTGDSQITFRGLDEKGFKELYVTGTSLNKQELIVFSNHSYPEMKIKDAVKASVTIPLYFEASFIDEKGRLYKNPKEKEGLDVVVDGGILGNFPIWIFDENEIDPSGTENRIYNPKTLGIRIDSESQIQNDEERKGLIDQEITDLKSYVEAFYVLTLENLNRNELIAEDWERTISVSSVGISPRIKRLKQEEKERLMNSGKESVIKFFEQEE